ncbi:MAG: glycerate kinase [Chloroflexota bacterium]
MSLKILVAPSAFKHSLNVNQVTSCITEGLSRSGLNAEIVEIPVADGGNGTVDAFLAQGGERVSFTVSDPLGRPVEADIAIVDEGQTVVIEMALASGLELLEDDERDPMRASTYGTGQLLDHALDSGARRIIVGMGGSATVDGGIGCISALGVQFFDAANEPLPATPESLGLVARIDTSAVDPRWHEVELIVAADVDNPVLGNRGAAPVFGPQKGAAPDQVLELDRWLAHYFSVVAEQIGVDVRQKPGSGAAGALAGGIMAFLNGRMQSGIDLLLDYCRFDKHLESANLVITGEGKLDTQTLGGKGPIGIVRRAKDKGVPAVILVGAFEGHMQPLRALGVTAVIPIVPAAMPLDVALDTASSNLTDAAERLGHLLALGMQLAMTG